MNDNMLYILKTIAETGSLKDKAAELKQLEFKNLAVKYRTGLDECNKNMYGKLIHKYHHGVKTDVGIFEVDAWAKLAYMLIDKYEERDLLNELKKYGFAFYTEKDKEELALELHMARIFENPEWVNYNEFKTTFLDKRDKML